MANFVGKKIVTTRKPQINIEPGLPPGNYLMEVVPVNADGKELQPAYMRIVMTDKDVSFHSVQIPVGEEKRLEEKLLQLLAGPVRILAEAVKTIAKRVREISGRDND